MFQLILRWDSIHKQIQELVFVNPQSLVSPIYQILKIDK